MNYKKVGSLVVIMLSIGILTGCAELNSDFDCPRKPGVSCESLDQVNDRVDRAECSGVKVPIYTPTSYKSLSSAEKNTDLPSRNRETVLPIWIGPYADNKGNYHDGSMVYSVSKSSHWEETYT